jgi:hypothetical protein
MPEKLRGTEDEKYFSSLMPFLYEIETLDLALEERCNEATQNTQRFILDFKALLPNLKQINRY